MLRRGVFGAAVALVGSVATAWSQPNATGPRLGYVYPAGGRQGTTLRVTVGGQLLRNAEEAYVSGEGVQATVAEYIRPLDNNELGYAARFLYELVRRRWSGRVMKSGDLQPLPDHPWLRDLNEKSPAELSRLRTRLFDPKKQLNTQIAEQVEIEVAIDSGAAPGDRELRLVTPAGLTNPVRFEVGTLPEVREEDAARRGDGGAPAELPVLLNGQILPGEADHFRLRARKGQKLVIRMEARRLIPYLADAVPGWFQGTMALYDPRGNEAAYADDYRFDPDPVLLYQVAEDGVYELEVRDAIFRGRDDFVYRIAVGELPFITQISPLGGQAGVSTVASVAGWNLPVDKLPLDTRPGPSRLCETGHDQRFCNAVAYAVDALPECTETEPNDTIGNAQKVTLPTIVNGRIGRPGDADLFAFDGRAGEELVAEVCGRRLGSPLDSALRLVDPTGAEAAANDDHEDPEMGLITHQADSYLRVRLTKDGTHLVYLSEAQRQGGEEYGYRLRLGPPQPDFAVRVTPSNANLAAGRSTAMTARAIRKDGFEGDIDVAITEAPVGFTLTGARIPSGKDSAELTLTAPRVGLPQVFPLQLEARAQVGGVTVTRPVVPAEDMMQAFAYRHLVPQQELLVAITGSRPVPAVWRPLLAGVQVASPTPVQVPLGGTAQVQVRAPQTLPGRIPSALKAARFELAAPPRGVTLRGTSVTPTGVILTVKADGCIADVGESGHLIVEVSTDASGSASGGQASARPRRVSLGVLPAIPIRVVRP